MVTKYKKWYEYEEMEEDETGEWITYEDHLSEMVRMVDRYNALVRKLEGYENEKIQ